MVHVGIREFKAHLSAYVRKVKSGQSLGLTEYGKVVATVTPAVQNETEKKLWRLTQKGTLDWRGGKPHGLPKRIPARGKLASTMALEDRYDRA